MGSEYYIHSSLCYQKLLLEEVVQLVGISRVSELMIRVTIDLIPYGFEDLKKPLSIIKIVNDGSGGRDTGNYRVGVAGETLGGWDVYATDVPLKGFDRNRGYLACVSECLNALVKELGD
jgi:hypothetical protein